MYISTCASWRPRQAPHYLANAFLMQLCNVDGSSKACSYVYIQALEDIFLRCWPVTEQSGSNYRCHRCSVAAHTTSKRQVCPRSPTHNFQSVVDGSLGRCIDDTVCNTSSSFAHSLGCTGPIKDVHQSCKLDAPPYNHKQANRWAKPIAWC